MLDVILFLIEEAARLLGAALAGLLAAGAFWLVLLDDNEALIQNRAAGTGDCAPWTFTGKGGRK
ncbi:hypothetical protein [Akkermansia muciniphila]|uniref:hypothetical protein n=1 Tax=Akkermansia muciniphila TaxID=239935 RepID=UPI001C061CCB|nr:hypothetical protein [Akkermansia muciniphila]QWP04834.1 hypothetical protein J5W77_09280 [Akkermansia muciniphila]QWP25003.1 hypothetical protein J5W81_03595 [Akkermansia muciniphila]QWP28629.1 hypothetical protein J5W80_09320 [Akkermansia muciniphila]